MRAARRTAEEQCRLIVGCRRSGLSDSGWCRENGINPATFYTWITRLKKRGSLPIPPSSSQSAGVRSDPMTSSGWMSCQRRLYAGRLTIKLLSFQAGRTKYQTLWPR